MIGDLEDRWRAQVDEYATALVWADHGRTLFVGDAGGGVSAFAAAQGALIWSHKKAHENGVLALDVHPNGLVSTGQDGTARLWDPQSGQARATIVADAPWVEHARWSPDGRRLALAAGRHITLHGPDGALLGRLPAQESTVSALAWTSPQELASACYGGATFWAQPQGVATQTLRWTGSLISMALSPNGQIVACGSQDNSVHFWRRKTGRDSEMTGYPARPTALAFDARGELLATGGGEAITVWSFAGGGPEGSEPGLLELHTGRITTLRFVHRGARLASGGRDGAVVVWEVDRRGQGKPMGAALLAGVVEALAWQPGDEALAAIDAGGVVALWSCRPEKKRLFG